LTESHKHPTKQRVFFFFKKTGGGFCFFVYIGGGGGGGGAKCGDFSSNICLPKNSFILINGLKKGKEKHFGERG